jgi:SAM-dependent methyltransferase
MHMLSSQSTLRGWPCPITLSHYSILHGRDQRICTTGGAQVVYNRARQSSLYFPCQLGMTNRADTIAAYLVPHFAPHSSVLEIGAGKGHVAKAIQDRAQVQVKLVDIVNYNETQMPLGLFDGLHLPFEDNAFDYGLLVYVLHHTPDPLRVLHEALRVSRQGVLVVENHVQGSLRQLITRGIDSIPHLQYGVPVCYHTHTIPEWEALFSQMRVRPELLGRFTVQVFWQSFVMKLNCPTLD